MGTETKVNCYSENSSNGSIPKVLKPTSETLSNNISQKFNTQLNISDIKTTSNDILEQQRNSEVPHVPIVVDEHNVIEGAKAILRVIRPNWDLKAVRFKNFTDGITNKLVGCFYTKPDEIISNGQNSLTNGSSSNHYTNGHSMSANDSTDNQVEDIDDNNDSGNLSDAAEDDEYDNDSANQQRSATPTETTSGNVVLVRVYGNKTDLLIDRKAETRNFKLLHSYGFAPSLYATFKNGLAYDYVPGCTLNANNILKPEVWQLVALRMAEMHRAVKSVPGRTESEIEPVPMLWKKTQSFLDLVPERFTSAEKHQRLEGTFLPISRLRSEFTELYKRLVALGSPLVFSHNDLLLGNVVYTESRQAVSFIDYEYADYNFQAFDIGNHFAEFAGVDEVDYSRYPSKDFQLKWLHVYLQEYLQRKNVTAAEVERLYVQVNQFALASHLFWTIWSLIQAEHSNIDFDYVDYAFVRYNEYLAKKQEFLALKVINNS